MFGVGLNVDARIAAHGLACCTNQRTGPTDASLSAWASFVAATAVGFVSLWVYTGATTGNLALRTDTLVGGTHLPTRTVTVTATVGFLAGPADAKLAGRTLVVTHTAAALVVFAQLTGLTIAAGSTLSTDATSVDTEFSSAALAVVGASGADVGQTQASVGAVSVGSAVSLLASPAEAQLAGGAVTIDRTRCTLVAFADLASLTIGAHATIGLQTHALQAKLPHRTLLVVGAKNTTVVFAHKTLLTIAQSPTVGDLAHTLQTKLTGEAVGVGGAGAAGVFDAHFSTRTVEAGFAIASQTGSVHAELSGAAFAVNRTRRTLVTGTDLTIRTFGGLATIPRLTGTVEAKLANTTGFVILARRANVVGTYQPTLAVGALDTSLADLRGRITDLPRLTLVVLTTARFAGARFTDQTGSALLVFAADRAFVVGANLSSRAILGLTTVGFRARVLQAKLACIALFVRKAALACITPTDLALLTVLVGETGHTLSTLCVALGALGTPLVIATSFDAAAVHTDFSLTARGVISASSTASFVANLTTRTDLLRATKRFHTALVFADLSAGTTCIVNAPFETNPSFADLPLSAVSVGFTRSTTTCFADLTSCTGLALRTTFGASAFFTDLVCATRRVVGATCHALLVFTNLAILALSVSQTTGRAGT